MVWHDAFGDMKLLLYTKCILILYNKYIIHQILIYIYYLLSITIYNLLIYKYRVVINHNISKHFFILLVNKSVFWLLLSLNYNITVIIVK